MLYKKIKKKKIDQAQTLCFIFFLPVHVGQVTTSGHQEYCDKHQGQLMCVPN